MLSDEKQRRAYDRGGFDGLNGHGHFRGFHDPFDIFQDMFSDSFGDDLFQGRFKDFDAIFEAMDEEGFGGGFGGGFGDGFGGGFGNFMSQSSSTSWVNGKKVTTISMNKNGKQIEEIYENDELIQRKINGKLQSLDAIEGSEGNEGNEERETRPQHRDSQRGGNRRRGGNNRGHRGGRQRASGIDRNMYQAQYHLDLSSLGTYGLMVIVVIFSVCGIWCCSTKSSHAHVQ